MPAKKGFTKEKGLGKRILNVWKYLPIGHTINLAKKDVSDKKIFSSCLYSFSPFYISALFGINSIKNYNENKRNLKQQHIQQVESTYDSSNIFQNAKNTEDSIEIANKYNIPYQLILKPSIKDKERIFKSLDSSFVK